MEAIIADDRTALSDAVRASGVQDPVVVVALQVARELVPLLVGEEGQVIAASCQQAADLLEIHLYSTHPQRFLDGEWRGFMRRALLRLAGDEKLSSRINHLHFSGSFPFLEEVVRHSLHLGEEEKVQSLHLRMAAISALLVPLRQTVGSCFATAPAILLQRDNPHAFVQDVDELSTTGFLSRVVRGESFRVPICLSWGGGELKRPLEGDFRRILSSPAFRDACFRVGVEPQLPLEGVRTVEELFQHFLQKHFSVDPKKQHRQAIPIAVEVIHGGDSLAGRSNPSSPRYELYKEALERASRIFTSWESHPLLRMWEYTLASFSETESNFSRYNLFVCLGLDPGQRGGLGDCIRAKAQELLDQFNRDIAVQQDMVEQVFVQCKYLEGRLKRASAEQEVRWIRAEYQSRRNEYESQQALLSKLQLQANSVANCPNTLIHQYVDLFKEYFQEVYDPDLGGEGGAIYDDRPAGFRLMYKQGRAHPKAWSYIRGVEEYTQALTSFFSLTEPVLRSVEELAPMEEEVVRIVTEVIMHVRTPEFLEGARQRLRSSQIASQSAEPWAYISGGLIDHLLQGYFGLDHPPDKKERWVEKPIELAGWLVDVIRGLPAHAGRNFLFCSPTHVFSLQVDRDSFAELIESRDYSYTWLRDRIWEPARRAIEDIRLDEEEVREVVSRIRGSLPDIRVRKEMGVGELRELLVRSWRALVPTIAVHVDSWLYDNLPLQRGVDVDFALDCLLRRVGAEPRTIERAKGIVTARELRELVLLAMGTKEAYAARSRHALVLKAAQELGLAMREPMVIGDTNWPHFSMAFVTNPGTGEFELWRVAPNSLEGFPMHEWKQWLDGSRKTPPWRLFHRPEQYRI